MAISAVVMPEGMNSVALTEEIRNMPLYITVYASSLKQVSRIKSECGRLGRTDITVEFISFMDDHPDMSIPRLAPFEVLRHARRLDSGAVLHCVIVPDYSDDPIFLTLKERLTRNGLISVFEGQYPSSVKITISRPSAEVVDSTD